MGTKALEYDECVTKPAKHEDSPRRGVEQSQQRHPRKSRLRKNEITEGMNRCQIKVKISSYGRESRISSHVIFSEKLHLMIDPTISDHNPHS